MCSFQVNYPFKSTVSIVMHLNCNFCIGWWGFIWRLKKTIHKSCIYICKVVMQKAHAKWHYSGRTQALVQWTATSGYIQMHRREPEVDTAWQPEPLDAQMALNSFWMATSANQKQRGQNMQVLTWIETVSTDLHTEMLGYMHIMLSSFLESSCIQNTLQQEALKMITLWKW